MAFADQYISKQTKIHELTISPQDDLGIVITIPCYDEPDLISSLNALWSCERPQCSVEVIVVVNSGVNAPIEALEQNDKTIAEFEKWNTDRDDKKLSFHLINIKDVPHKFAGVGTARKTAMDAAILRFNGLGRKNGVIAGYDADSLCEDNYLKVLESEFLNSDKLEGVSIRYEHPVEGADFHEGHYKGITDYELHLRYFVQAQKWAGLPFAFHTVGSSFAVKAHAYVKYGGMNRKKAGEDFYFLQKFIPHKKFGNINSTAIIPSPRSSDRVPFGTGASIRKMENQKDFSFDTYSFKSFFPLKQLAEHKLVFYKSKMEEVDKALFDSTVWQFMEENDFESELEKINMHSPNEKIFTDRFYQWWNAFRAMKYLNWVHEKHWEKEQVGIASNLLLEKLGHETRGDNLMLLMFYRELDRRDEK